MKPFFSIVIPTYNREKELPKALNSVTAQTFSNWEILLVDDGSTDNTRQIVTKCNDERIRYFYQENQERSASRNSGLKVASGQYICFLDSDDEYVPDYLFNLHENLVDNKFPEALVKSVPVLSYSNGDKKVLNEDFQGAQKGIDHFLTTYSPLCAICGHSRIFREFQFDGSLRFGEDTNLWMRILTKYPLYYFNIRSCVVHLREDMDQPQESIHKAYLKSFKKTFTIPEVKEKVSTSVIRKLFHDRMQWVRAEKKRRGDFLGYLAFTVKVQLLKLGIF